DAHCTRRRTREQSCGRRRQRDTMVSAFEWIRDELESLGRAGLLRSRAVRTRAQGALIHWNGRQYLNFSSNDYLGLAAELNPRRGWLVEGCGRGASPLIIGRGEWHERLEEELAACGLAEAAFLFSSGYAANVGCITALAGKSDVFFSDAKNHAGIIYG